MKQPDEYIVELSNHDDCDTEYHSDFGSALAEAEAKVLTGKWTEGKVFVKSEVAKVTRKVKVQRER